MDNNLTELEKAYFAGFIDGEGSITICKAGRAEYEYYVSVTVANSVIKPLEILAETYGGYLQEKKWKNGLKRKRAWWWQLTRRNSVRLLKDILPYLVIKRKQAELALAYQEHIEKLKETKKNLQFSKNSNEEVQYRQEKRMEMKVLNGTHLYPYES